MNQKTLSELCSADPSAKIRENIPAYNAIYEAVDLKVINAVAKQVSNPTETHLGIAVEGKAAESTPPSEEAP